MAMMSIARPVGAARAQDRWRRNFIISVTDDENEMKKSKGKRGKKTTMTVSCTVCCGSGRIKTKKRDLESSNDLGEITRCRRCPKEFVDLGCQPERIVALLEKNDINSHCHKGNNNCTHHD